MCGLCCLALGCGIQMCGQIVQCRTDAAHGLLYLEARTNQAPYSSFIICNTCESATLGYINLQALDSTGSNSCVGFRFVVHCNTTARTVGCITPCYGRLCWVCEVCVGGAAHFAAAVHTDNCFYTSAGNCRNYFSNQGLVFANINTAATTCGGGIRFIQCVCDSGGLKDMVTINYCATDTTCTGHRATLLLMLCEGGSAATTPYRLGSACMWMCKTLCIASCDLVVAGSLSKGSGTFNIQHPCEDTTTPNEYNSKRLIHGFIEGPKHGIQYDGEAVLCDGIAMVKLPEYFDKLASRDAPIHIQLTNIDGWTPLVIKLQNDCKVCGNCFYVCTTDDGVKNAKFVWQVSGSRGDKFVKNDTTSTDDRGLLCVEMWEDSGHAKESEIDVLTTVQLKEYMDYNTITYTGSENDSELASLIMAEQTRRLPD